MLLRYYLREKREEKEIFNNYDLFLFGSYLNNPKEANDIDLLIVYDKKNQSIEEILNERKCLRKLIGEKFSLPVQICILSREEYSEENIMQYIKKEKLKWILLSFE